MPHLVVVGPGGGQQRYVLDQPEYVLGRDPGVQIPLSDRKVSRKHARIFHKDQAFWVEDLGSANGVIIDGRPITKARKLLAGAVVDIGGFQLTFEEDAAASAGSFALLGLNDPFEGQSFLLPSGDLPIGRVDGCAIVIPHPSISRKHATMRVTATQVTVEDHGSSNGTWVNGERVPHKPVQPGDRVRFGNVEFELVSASSSEVSAGAAVRGWSLLRRADRTLQVAVVVGLLFLVLLAVTVVVWWREPKGPTSTAPSIEQQFFQAIETELARGREAGLAGAWDEAELAYERVLDRDPIHREARRGLARAQSNLRDRETLAEARARFDDGNPQATLDTLLQIPGDSYYIGDANQLAAGARQAIAQKALAKAGKACRRSEWRECHALAIRVLEQHPSSEPGRALLSQAESSMRARRLSFTPWAPPSGSASSPGIEAAYPDEELRAAVLRYSAGDLDSAMQQTSAHIDRKGARELSEALTSFRTAWTEGKGAKVAGDRSRAIEAWEGALTADARILPESHPSTFRDNLRRELSAELFRLGDTALGRGNHGGAFEAWNRGLRYNPADPNLLGGIARLESRARDLLDKIPGRGHLRPAKCNRLREILATTRSGAQVHAAARKRKSSGCRK